MLIPTWEKLIIVDTKQVNNKIFFIIIDLGYLNVVQMYFYNIVQNKNDVQNYGKRTNFSIFGRYFLKIMDFVVGLSITSFLSFFDNILLFVVKKVQSMVFAFYLIWFWFL